MSELPPLSPGVYPIISDYELNTFNCGVPALDDYLRKFALANHHNGAARTYVALRGNRVVGYFTLAVGSGLSQTCCKVAFSLFIEPYYLLSS